MKRSTFAMLAGIGREILVRLELGRMPLRYGIARKFCNAHKLDPEFLATGRLTHLFIYDLPIAANLGAQDSDLFSEVFKRHLAGRAGEFFWRNMYAANLGAWIDEAFERANTDDLILLNSQIEEELLRVFEHYPAETFRDLVRKIESGKNDLMELSPFPIPPQPKQSRLTHMSTARKNELVQWNRLKARILKAAAIPGGKSTLAKVLGVDLTQISRWLSKTGPEPGATITLKMLQWVQEQERQQ